MPSKYFQIDGVATYVQHTGRTTLPEAPPHVEAGTPLVCLHGAGGNGHPFAGLMERLGDGHTVIAFDQPGHGRSGGLDSLGDIGAMADFTLALLDALDLARVALLGHDMGGAVALRCALERPERVAGVVVCSAGDRFELAGDAAAAMQRVRDGKARRAFDPTIFAKKTGQDVMKEVFMEGLKTDPRATHGDLLACAAWDDRDRLPGMKAPALVVHGEEDHGPVQAAARSLVDRLPSAELVTVPDAGHAILFEAPDVLADRVRPFLEALPA